MPSKSRWFRIEATNQESVERAAKNFVGSGAAISRKPNGEIWVYLSSKHQHPAHPGSNLDFGVQLVPITKSYQRRQKTAKPYVCNICKKPFTSSLELVQHHSIHAKEKVMITEVRLSDEQSDVLAKVTAPLAHEIARLFFLGRSQRGIANEIQAISHSASPENALGSVGSTISRLRALFGEKLFPYSTSSGRRRKDVPVTRVPEPEPKLVPVVEHVPASVTTTASAPVSSQISYQTRSQHFTTSAQVKQMPLEELLTYQTDLLLEVGIVSDEVKSRMKEWTEIEKRMAGMFSGIRQG